MNREDKIKLEIERSIQLNNSRRFDITQINSRLIAGITILLALFLPFIINLDFIYSLILWIILIIYTFIVRNKTLPKIKKLREEIEKESQKINNLYKKLGIK